MNRLTNIDIAEDGWPVLAVAGAVTILVSFLDLPTGCFLLGLMMWLAHILRVPHRLEFVLVDNAGQAVAQYLLPLRTRDLQKGLDGSQLVIVNKGDALWRIAYRSFGKGVRYIDIVRKNTGDIDNPDLIYPNQIFALPKSGATN